MHAQKETDEKPKKKRMSRFLKWFLIVAVLFVAVAGAFLYFNLCLTSGSGPAGPDVPIEPFKYVWYEQDVLLLGMGDSITVGLGAAKGFSYFDRLVKSPQEDGEEFVAVVAVDRTNLDPDHRSSQSTETSERYGGDHSRGTPALPSDDVDFRLLLEDADLLQSPFEGVHSG